MVGVGGRGGSTWGPGKLATRTSAKPQSPTSPHARPSVIKLQMSHRERTNPRGHDRRTDSAALLEGIRGDGRPARQDPLRDGGEDHDTYMMRENGLPPVAMKERRREREKERKREREKGDKAGGGPTSGAKPKHVPMAPRRLGGEQGGAFLLRSAKGGNFLLQSYVFPRSSVPASPGSISSLGRQRTASSDGTTHAHSRRSPPRTQRVCLDPVFRPSWCKMRCRKSQTTSTRIRGSENPRAALTRPRRSRR